MAQKKKKEKRETPTGKSAQRKNLKIERFKDDMGKLNEQEKEFFKMMLPNSGVLSVIGPPGGCKSALFRSIANKMGFQFFDIRLPLIDETDIGLYPIKNETTDPNTGKEITTLDYAIPKWAIDANSDKSIIVFDEFNRADEAKRNAAMQILLERQIGTEFEFNDDVFMVALGNMGDEDGTNVEEFDTAMNNRLIHYKKFHLPMDSWIEGFAKDNVHPVIVEYLSRGNEEMLHSIPSQEGEGDGEGGTLSKEAFPTHRSWTFLSDYIIANYGWDSSPQDWEQDVKNVGMKYIGNSISKFMDYCDKRKMYSLQDVVDRFEKIEEDLRDMGRDKITEIYYEAKEKEGDASSEEDSFLCSLSKKQLENYIKFMHILDDDQKYNIFDTFPMRDQNKKEGESNIDRVLEEFGEMIEKIADQEYANTIAEGDDNDDEKNEQKG